MEQLMEIVRFLLDNGPALISALVGVLSAVIAVSLLLPGPEPERTLQKIVEFISKFSRKP